jgi:hypothetical protein
VEGVASVEDLAMAVLEDARSELVDGVLAFRYLKREKRGCKPVQSLVAPAAVLRATITAHLVAGNWRIADALAALMCESATESVGDEETISHADLEAAGIPFDADASPDRVVSQTPFDFTSRNVQFLDQLRRIRDVLTVESIADELLHGVGSPCDRIMRWDALVDKPWALYGSVSAMTRPAAEWLVFRGLPFFTLVAGSGHVLMPGFAGRRKAGQLSWPLWERPLSRDVIRTVLGVSWRARNRSELLARGLQPGFEVALKKDATGYDGAVSPGQPWSDPSGE